jgi:hypothetical protein
MKRSVHLCSFEAVDLGPHRDISRRLRYDEFKARVLAAGRFSVFEATETLRVYLIVQRRTWRHIP